MLGHAQAPERQRKWMELILAKKNNRIGEILTIPCSKNVSIDNLQEDCCVLTLVHFPHLPETQPRVSESEILGGECERLD